MPICRPVAASLAIALLLATSVAAEGGAGAPAAEPRAALRERMEQKDFAAAYDGFRRLALDPATDRRQVGADLVAGVRSLTELDRANEIDAFRAEVVRLHSANWRLLQAAAISSLETQHRGYLIDGTFHRGRQRGGGRVVDATQRDRGRALQLLVGAMPLAEREVATGGATRAEVAGLYFSLARALLGPRGFRDAWRLQRLTPLAELPPYEPGWGPGDTTPAAAATGDGLPQLYAPPASWERAASDGERWRWALARVVERAPSRLHEIRAHRANFLWEQFGVQTLRPFGEFPDPPDDLEARAAEGKNVEGEENQADVGAADGSGGETERGRGGDGNRVDSESDSANEVATGSEDVNGKESNREGANRDGQRDDTPSAPAPLRLDALGDDETLARLAVGVRRFSLPEEHNFIRLYRQVADDDPQGYGRHALRRLAEIFENRRRYPRAAELWRESIVRHGEEIRNQARLQQIVGNWGRFEPVTTQPAGSGAEVGYRFRNGRRVALEAHRIDVDKLLADVQAYLESQPGRPAWERIDLGNIGHRLVTANQREYLGPRVAAWKTALEPRPAHRDRRITLKTPLEKPGAYLLTARMEGGNTTHIVLWVSDLAIVKKPLAGEACYFVADAVSGDPLPGCELELFGYRPVRAGEDKFRVETRRLQGVTDADGLYFQKADAPNAGYRWIATARTSDGRLAWLGFTQVWQAHYHEADYRQVKAMTLTDRPLYRPGQEVRFKAWIRRAQYDQEETSHFAHQTFRVEIHDPSGNQVHGASLTADAYGGIGGNYPLPADAAPGLYRLQVVGRGGGTFRVAAGEPPRFDVRIEVPAAPVRPGEKAIARIRATHSSGAPLTGARVRYRIVRTDRDRGWHPPDEWDWLYGAGYGWFAPDAPWYPGWKTWGSRAPSPPWWPQREVPPEVVAEYETSIGADGSVPIEIDTAFAAALHPDRDHHYQITAEVTDSARMTVAERGSVLTARRPFEVYTWVNRGHYRVGEVVRASFRATTLDDRPVAGQGKVTLLSVRYDSRRRPVESAVAEWDLATDAHGRADLQIKATAAGQYRLAYRLVDGDGRRAEAGHLLTIVGEEFDAAGCRFNDLELIPDRRAYRPGEKVRLLVNADRVGGSVLLFLRPSSGVYLRPQLVRLTGKSQIVEVPVGAEDMPNFFVEAVRVADGRLRDVTREIHVPPARRALGVEVVPSSVAYKPGQSAEVTVKLTDDQGEPVVGGVVLAIYDKALERAVGESHVAGIREFYWKWRRRHFARVESSLVRRFASLAPPDSPGMREFGAPRGEGDAGNGTFPRADGAPPRGADGRRLAGEGDDTDLFVPPADGDDVVSPPPIAPTTPTRSADAALWKGGLVTGPDGLARVELKLPGEMATWQVRAWGMGHGTRVGEGAAELVTRKDLRVLLRAPRFFVQKDEVLLAADIRNSRQTAKEVEVSIELERDTLAALNEATTTVTVPADGERRIEWPVKALRAGEAVVRMAARSGEDTDALELRLPVLVHGTPRRQAFAGALHAGQQEARFSVVVPDGRRVNQTRLEIRYTPTLAGALVDALPWLVRSPADSTEQTLNRFLPTAIVRDLLLERGLDLAAIRARRSRPDRATPGDDEPPARPAGGRAAADGAASDSAGSNRAGSNRAGSNRAAADGAASNSAASNSAASGDAATDKALLDGARLDNIVFDEGAVGRMVAAGVRDLARLQRDDGGWSWLANDPARSEPHATAVVVHGLQVARAGDVALPPALLEGGVGWLAQYQREQLRRLQPAATGAAPSKPRADNLDALAHLVLVDAGQPSGAMQDLLFRDRGQLSIEGQVLLGLALHADGASERLAAVLGNLRRYLVRDPQQRNAWLNLPRQPGSTWYGNLHETNACYLKLLTRTEPAGATAAELANYLLSRRQEGGCWNSTRDSALCIEALAEYATSRADDRPDLVVEVWIDGQKQKEVPITAAESFTFDNRLVIRGDALQAGRHTIRLVKRGGGPLYWNGSLSHVALEERTAAAGQQLRLQRRAFKLTPIAAPSAASGPVHTGSGNGNGAARYARSPLADGARLELGDLVEIELELESGSDCEHVIVEERPAAGLEPVEIHGGDAAEGGGAYVARRPYGVVLLLRRLPRGRQSFSYRLRAEIPGRYRALPAQARALYAPELKANSDELRLEIVDRPSE